MRCLSNLQSYMKQSTLKEGDAVLSNLQSYVKQSTLKEGDAVLVKPAIIHETVNTQGR